MTLIEAPIKITFFFFLGSRLYFKKLRQKSKYKMVLLIPSNLDAAHHGEDRKPIEAMGKSARATEFLAFL